MKLRTFLFTLLITSYTNLSIADELIIGAGKFDIPHSDSWMGTLEYRSSKKFWKINPIIGAIANTKNGRYIYAGINIYLPLTSFFIASINVAPGYYHKGNGKNLGGAFEIKSQFELWYLLRNDYKIGAAISHMSNACLYKKNPGLENATLQISIHF